MSNSRYFFILAFILAPIAVADNQKCLTEKKLCSLVNISTVSELFEQLGPTKDVGSGLFVYSYPICDKSHLIVNSSDMKTILKMKMRKKSNDKTEDLSYWQKANCQLDETQKALQP